MTPEQKLTRIGEEVQALQARAKIKYHDAPKGKENQYYGEMIAYNTVANLIRDLTPPHGVIK